MHKCILLLLILFISIKSIAQKKNVQKTDFGLAEMMNIFEGEFDNFQQVYKEKEDKKQEIHEHIHSIFKKIFLPQIGENVFYVLQYMDGDSTKIYRQRLYNFISDNNEKAIRLDIYSFKNDSNFYYSHVDTAKLKSISFNDLTASPGCAVYWKKINNDFIGYMKKDSCNFISKRSGKKIFITDSLKLNEKEIWIRDEAYDENGGYVFGNKEKIAHKLKRCSFYKGWILLQKAGFDDKYIQARNLVWHDQGKRIRLKTEDGENTKYEVELAAVVYGKDLEVLKLAVYEVGKDKAVFYTWATPGSKNIGVNMRWIQAGLTKIE